MCVLTVGTPSTKINIRTHFSHLLYAVLLTLTREASLTAQYVTPLALLSLHGLSKETQQKITQPNCFQSEEISSRYLGDCRVAGPLYEYVILIAHCTTKQYHYDNIKGQGKLMFRFPALIGLFTALNIEGL